MNEVTVNKVYLKRYGEHGKLFCTRCNRELKLGEKIYTSRDIKKIKRTIAGHYRKPIRSKKKFYCLECINKMYRDVSDNGLEEIELIVK